LATPALAAEDVDFLALLSEANRTRLLERSKRRTYQAGTIIVHAGLSPPPAFIVEQGLVRAFWSTPEGREATVAFLHSRELLGALGVMSRSPNISAQFVVDSTCLALTVSNARALATTEVEVADAVAIHLSAQLRNAFRLVAVRSLGTIRERLAYDLLERACRSQLVTGRLEVRATHADLADSIGTSREVVTRALGELRGAGVLATAQRAVRVADPMRLATIVRSFVI
jgi:CRP-like cAMP-binding protein